MILVNFFKKDKKLLRKKTKIELMVTHHPNGPLTSHSILSTSHHILYNFIVVFYTLDFYHFALIRILEMTFSLPAFAIASFSSDFRQPCFPCSDTCPISDEFNAISPGYDEIPHLRLSLYIYIYIYIFLLKKILENEYD